MSGIGAISGQPPIDPAASEAGGAGGAAESAQQAAPGAATAVRALPGLESALGAGAPLSSAWAIRAGLGGARGRPALASGAAAGIAAAQRPPGRAEAMPSLRPGARGPDVLLAQERLNDFRTRLGLKPLAQDGVYGPRSREGVQLLQRLWGLPADGVVGRYTWRRLLGEPNPAPMTPVPGTITAKVLAHREAILEASGRTGIPAPILAGLIEKESGGLADAVGMRGERGVLQLRAEAHPEFFARADWSDARASIDYAAGVLRDELRAWSGDADRALAAVNAGPAAVKKGLREGKPLEAIPAKPNYVANVLKYAERYHDHF